MTTTQKIIAMETKRKYFKYIAINDAPKPEHIHNTQVKKGFEYLIAKENDDFVKVIGTLFNRLGGHVDVIEKSIRKSEIQPYVKRVDKRKRM